MKAGTELREPRGPQMGEKERAKSQSLRKDQCAYFKELGHWKNECPKRDPKRGTTQRERISPGTRVLYAGEDSDSGSRDSAPLPESWVTIHVEGKPVGFMVDTGAQHSVLNQRLGPMSKKTSLVQGNHGDKKILLDHRTESKSRDPPGVPFVFGDTRMPSSSTWKRLID